MADYPTLRRFPGNWRGDVERDVWIAEDRVRRAALKDQYERLFADMAALFFEVDPAGVNYDENSDEYEPEVGTVLPRLKSAESAADVRQILDEEFDFWFESSYSRDRMSELAERLWILWSASGDPVA